RAGCAPRLGLTNRSRKVAGKLPVDRVQDEACWVMREPSQISKPHRLNRRVVQQIPAHGAVRYAIVPPALPQLRPGIQVTVNWLLRAPGLRDAATHAVAFDLAMTA